MVENPVLFITFVRPEYARKSWDAIKASQPKTLYFYSNKGRAEIEGEVEKNEEIRSFIKEIDWECNLHTWFRDECVSVYDSLRGAIDWLFNNEEQGIILEEDCVPTMAFFSFVDQLLDFYKNENHIWCISGDNYLDNFDSDYDYVFSYYHWMFGWATWRRIWNNLKWDRDSIIEAIKTVQYRTIYKTSKQVLYKRIELYQVRDLMIEKKCWDYLFGLFCDCNKGITICPKEHLISNVGFTGAHHKDDTLSIINKPANPTYNDYIIKKHPQNIEGDLEFDRRTFYAVNYIPLIIRIFRRIKRSIRSLIR